jgi:hypothetical protein
MRSTPGLLALATLLTAAATTASAQQTVSVYITNLSKQIISPPVVASHSWMVTVVGPGQPADPALALQAEDGDPSALVAALEADPEVLDVAVGDRMLMPGERMILEVEMNGRYNRISATGMLVTTNDGFFGLDGAQVIPNGPNTQRFDVPAWDAGTEANSESCAFIPGPPCGNPFQRDTGGAEGFVHIHPGLHGGGDLSVAEWGWQNPVVRIQIRRN